ncbi:hypothetical protein WAI453_002593 [Rhynchosporium graminicola]
MKLLILSLLASGAISAAVGGAGLEARAVAKACTCNLMFLNTMSVTTKNIPTLPGQTQLGATLHYVDSGGNELERLNACRVTWDRGQNPHNCNTWKQAAGPDGPNCPRSIFVKGDIKCFPIY